VISNNETSIRFLYSTLIEADVQEKNQVFIFSNKFLKDKLEKNVSGTKMYIDFDNLLNDLEQKMAR
jgi:hypothetical protein